MQNNGDPTIDGTLSLSVRAFSNPVLTRLRHTHAARRLTSGRMTTRRAAGAFTLLELLLSWSHRHPDHAHDPVYGHLKERAQRCSMANLRGLYVGTEAYLQRNGSWPQIFLEELRSAGGLAKRLGAAPRLSGSSAARGFARPCRNCSQPRLQRPGKARPTTSRPGLTQTDLASPMAAPTLVHRNGDVHGNGNLIISPTAASWRRTIAAENNLSLVRRRP